jgi:tryptophanyl-tRNA synthetase
MPDYVVTPWEVKGDVDYNRLVKDFGTQLIDQNLLESIEKHTKTLHFMLRRGVFYSHRDFNWVLKEYEKGNPFYLYTGRGPSGQTQLGHLMPWIFTKYLQDEFGAKLYFQMTDDEKFLFKDDLSLEDTRKLAYDNALDIIALGFDPEKTFIVVDTECISALYNIALKVAKRVTFSTAKAVFGFTNSNNIGSIFYTSIQAVPAFLESELTGKNVPCVIPCAIDQDAHFRVARDVAPLLGYYKPSILHCKLLPTLSGEDKMSSSSPHSAISTTDSEKEIRAKIADAFTGGRVSIEEQKKLGGNPEICSVYCMYNYMFEPDDDALRRTYEDCKAGKLMCGDDKAILADKVVEFLGKHQEKREEAREKLDSFLWKP